VIAAAIMGDPNASIPNPQPEYYRPMFGAFGRSMTESSVIFVSQAGLAKSRGLGVAKKLIAVTNTRNIGKRSMMLNSATPEWRLILKHTRCGPTAAFSLANPQKYCPWLNAISCTDMTMQSASTYRPAGHWPKEKAAGSLTLDFDARHRRRIRLTGDQGEDVLLNFRRRLPWPMEMACNLKMGGG